jgi:hypothetical protein
MGWKKKWLLFRLKWKRKRLNRRVSQKQGEKKCLASSRAVDKLLEQLMELEKEHS